MKFITRSGEAVFRCSCSTETAKVMNTSRHSLNIFPYIIVSSHLIHAVTEGHLAVTVSFR